MADNEPVMDEMAAITHNMAIALHRYRTTKGESRQPWAEMMALHNKWLEYYCSLHGTEPRGY
jgi:hypothetical protein